MLGHFGGERLGEAHHAGLGCGVVGLAAVAIQTDHRTHIYNDAAALFDHLQYEWLGGIEHAAEIGVDDAVPLVAVHARQHSIAGDSGIVDQPVHALESADDAFCENDSDDEDRYGHSYEKYGGYNGWSDDAIDDAFEGDPDATWNVD